MVIGINMNYKYYYSVIATQGKGYDRWYIRIDPNDNSVYLLDNNEWHRILVRAESVRKTYMPITYEDLILELI